MRPLFPESFSAWFSLLPLTWDVKLLQSDWPNMELRFDCRVHSFHDAPVDKNMW